MSAPVDKDIPIFQDASIKAMSPLGQEIARLLKDAGWIRITDVAEPVKV